MYPPIFVTSAGHCVEISFIDRFFLKFIREEYKVCFYVLKELFRHHKANADFNDKLANEELTNPLWDKQFEPNVTKEQVRLYFRHLLDKNLITYDYDKRDDSLQIAITGKGIVSAVSNQFLVDGKKEFIERLKNYLEVGVFIATILLSLFSIYKGVQDNHCKKYREEVEQMEQKLQLIEERQKVLTEELKHLNIILPQIEESVLSDKNYVDKQKKIVDSTKTFKLKL